MATTRDDVLEQDALFRDRDNAFSLLNNRLPRAIRGNIISQVAIEAANELSQADRLLVANQILETLESELPGANIDDSELLKALEERSGQWEHSISWEELRQQLETGG